LFVYLFFVFVFLFICLLLVCLFACCSVSFAENVLLKKELVAPNQSIWNVKIADFGSARQYSCHASKTMAGCVGTTCYRPPELWCLNYGKADHCLTFAVDIWALGVFVVFC
jgi:serine/threonine protein kinase